jgi:hypothetical protein
MKDDESNFITMSFCHSLMKVRSTSEEFALRVEKYLLLEVSRISQMRNQNWPSWHKELH